MKEIKIGKNADKLYGVKYGKLKAINPVGRTKNNQIKWLWSCDCGETTVVAGNDVKSGHTSSCGCVHSNMLANKNYKHGHGERGNQSGTLKAYYQMKARIFSKSYHAREKYRNRSICDRWLDAENGFNNFLKDMGEKPDGLTLERIDNDKGYSPDNCKWATMKEQSNNRSNTVKVSHNGKLKTLREIADEDGISYNRAYYLYR